MCLIFNAPGGMGSQCEIVMDWLLIEYYKKYSGSPSSVSRLLRGDARQHQNLREVYKGPDGQEALIESTSNLLSLYPGVSARMRVYDAVTSEKTEAILSVEEVAKVVGIALYEAITR
jgi:hypothetical protein